jgi:hypothetical protein
MVCFGLQNRPLSAGQWPDAVLVPTHSGGTAPVSHRLPFSSRFRDTEALLVQRADLAVSKKSCIVKTALLQVSGRKPFRKRLDLFQPGD